jgi:hypothetical protein
MVKLWRYEGFVDVEVWGQVEEEVAAVEVDDWWGCPQRSW